MAHGRPWYKRNGADLVMATLSFPSSDHKWAYSAIIDILNERDRPIADDPGFICGFTGLSKRRWTPVRQWLLDHGYLQLTPDGGLTNARFEREREERRQYIVERTEDGVRGARKAAEKRPDRQGKLEFISGSSRDNPEIIPGKTEDNFSERDVTSPKNNNLAEGDPQASRGRERAKEARIESNQTNDHITTDVVGKRSLARSLDSTPGSGLSEGQPSPAGVTGSVLETASPPPGTPGQERPVAPKETAPAGRLNSRDLFELYEACTAAAGFCPIQPGHIDREMKIVERWRKAGFDFDQVVVPTITAEIARTDDDPTSSLQRFDRAIRHEAARHKAAKTNGSSPPPPPAVPILDPPGEDPLFLPIRKAMLAHLGPQLYPLLLNDVTFEAAQQGNRRPIIVHGKSYMIENVVHGDNSRALTAIARKHGFTELWKGT